MRGTMAERKTGVWKLRVYVGDDSKGHPVQRTRTVHGGRRHAEDELRRFVAEVERLRSPERGATVERLLDRWLDHLEGRARPYTIRSYRYVIDARIVPALGSKRLDQLRTHHLDSQYRAWMTEGVSPASVRKYHSILSAAFRQAVKWEWIGRSPTANASPPSPSAPFTRVMSAGDVRALVAAAEATDPVLAAAIALAALTGCRRGELCALRWSDYDPTSTTLTVARSLTSGSKGAYHEGETKTHQLRRLSLDPVAVQVVERHQAWQRDLSARAESPLVDDPRLLSRSAHAGEACKPDGLSHGFTRVARGLKLPYHFHELRHFAATIMITAGVNPRMVASRLGHSHPHITLRTYAHAVESADQAAALVLGQALSPTGGQGD